MNTENVMVAIAAFMTTYGDFDLARTFSNVIVAKQNNPSNTEEVALIPMTVSGQANLGQLTWQKWLVDSLNPALPVWAVINGGTNVILWGKFYRNPAPPGPGNIIWNINYKNKVGIVTKVTSLDTGEETTDVMLCTNEFSCPAEQMNFSGYVLVYTS